MRGIIIVISGIVAIYFLAMVGVLIAVNNGWTNVAGKVDTEFQLATVKQKDIAKKTDFPWTKGEEWATFKAGIVKDLPLINKAAAEAGVSPRLIMTNVAVEQLRLYNSEREVFKEVFAPLKMLGNQVQFSWGVAGLKEETAKVVETNLKDHESPFYPGPRYEHLLDFQTADSDKERFERIADEHNHYYSYLYTGLYLREIISQWQRAGFNITNRPEILATLYNIGPSHSNPNPDPQVGGAELEINGSKYTFGSLAYEIFYSSELLSEFPQ